LSGSSQARLLRVFGIVQGVGFRPFVYRLADRYGLAGWVRNTSGDVAIHLEGPEEALDSFQEALQREKPPLAWIERVEIAPAEVTGASGFSIDASEVHGGDFQPVSPDVATCSDCLAELFDPRDRRYLYHSPIAPTVGPVSPS
jgi:hydrogenase maturation protein HypF